MIPLVRPWFSSEEAQAASEVINSGWLIQGEKVKEFERQFALKIGVKHAVAVNSGSSALLIAQQALGVGRGDEVIVPDMTFVSTASSSLYLGAQPTFVDIDLSIYCIDPQKIERKITEKTKGIIPVHYAGQSADLNEILEIAHRYDLFVLEDAAEAHLSEYNGKKVGSIGDIGIFSFTPSKVITVGEGGMITTSIDELADKARLIRNFYDTAKFKWDGLGFNFRMMDITAVIGLVQLKKLERAIELRRNIAKVYTEEFSKLEEIIPPFVCDDRTTNYQLYTIRLDRSKLLISRDDFINQLQALGIASRLYYPTLHNQGVFKHIKSNDKDFTCSNLFAQTALSLPIFPSLMENEIIYIIESVRSLVKKFKKI